MPNIMSGVENPPIFPVAEVRGSDGCGLIEGYLGMRLRDYFAASIAVGMSSFTGTKGEGYGPGSIAQRSYEIADAMLVERAKETSQ